MSLITAAELKEMVKITSTDFDTLIGNLVLRLNETINTYVNHQLDDTLYEEIYSSENGFILMVDQFPIISVTALSLDIDKTARTYSSPYVTAGLMINNRAGIIEIPGVPFAANHRGIYIKYNAGYVDANMPKDLKMVALEMGAKKFQDIQEKRIGLTSKNVMNDTINYSLVNLPKANRDILDRYIKPPNTNGITVTGYTEV